MKLGNELEVATCHWGSTFLCFFVREWKLGIAWKRLEGRGNFKYFLVISLICWNNDAVKKSKFLLKLIKFVGNFQEVYKLFRSF